MNSYNGFSPSQRNRAQAWLRAEWTSGRLARPARCCACGQTEGVIDAHAEDYSEPFAAGKTDEFHLCFICHLMVHCRLRSPAAWKRYRAAIHEGKRFRPFYTRNFGRFAAGFLGKIAPEPGPDFEQHEPPARRPLDEIEERAATAPPIRRAS